MAAVPSPGRRPSLGSRPPIHRPTPGQSLAVSMAVQKAVGYWKTANLTGRHQSELERGLAVVCRHPDAYSMGYSAASNARQRLTAELASRVNQKLNNPF